MSVFLKAGTRFRVSSKKAMDLHEELPVATYTIGFDECSKEYFLEQIEGFEIKGKLYGKINRHADRIFQTFQQRNKQTGVLLSGEKGSGKSLLAKKLSIISAKVGIPTIVINQSWFGEKFNSFIQSITQPKLVIFDEFEKIYKDQSEEREQEQLLTLLDGVYGSNTLFVLTCNDPERVNSAMKNRPGRIYYLIEFSGLEEAFIREYCEDNLDNKSQIEEICSISHLFMGKFNFDMLKAMVEELNRYSNDSPSDVLELLNVKPQHADQCEHRIKLVVNGKLMNECNMGMGGTWHGNPTCNGVSLECYDNEGGQKNYTFAVADLKHLDGEKGKYVFVNKKHERLILTREASGARGWKHDAPIPTNDRDYTSDLEQEVKEGRK